MTHLSEDSDLIGKGGEGRALLALAERIEALTGPSREVDDAIANALALIPETHERAMNHGRPQAYYWHKQDHRGAYWMPSAYTASVDASLELVGPNSFWRVGHDGEGADPSVFRADVGEPIEFGFVRSIAATPALALCAAALRARAAA